MQKKEEDLFASTCCWDGRRPRIAKASATAEPPPPPPRRRPAAPPAAGPAPALAGETRQGIDLTPFNSLSFQYRGSDFGGLDGSSVEEPTITYKDFLERLGKGEVEFVEFIAPDGDVAYATLKAPATGGEGQGEGEGVGGGGGRGATRQNQRIRIGEGFPIEQHDGWSSPAFAIKTVKKFGVPYKFTVPGLEKYAAM